MSSPTTATFLEPPDFFVDAGLGTIAIPGFIAGRGHKVTTKVDVFGARRVPDTEWLQWCGASWVAITKDEAAVRRVKDEIKAARRYKVRLFYFPNQQLRSETLRAPSGDELVCHPAALPTARSVSGVHLRRSPGTGCPTATVTTEATRSPPRVMTMFTSPRNPYNQKFTAPNRRP